jgi:serine/threonine protein phosphatase PrpC
MAALTRVNGELIELARSVDSQRTIGSTVVGLAIADGEFRCFWAGDSRAYRLRDGKISRLSRDHSLVQDLVDAGMLSADEAEGHPNANVITRAVGVTEDLKFDVVSGDVRLGDQFVLASDGMTRLVEDHEVAAQLATADLDDAIDALIEMVLSRGAPDNVSIVITEVV